VDYRHSNHLSNTIIKQQPRDNSSEDVHFSSVNPVSTSNLLVTSLVSGAIL